MAPHMPCQDGAVPGSPRSAAEKGEFLSEVRYQAEAYVYGGGRVIQAQV